MIRRLRNRVVAALLVLAALSAVSLNQAFALPVDPCLCPEAGVCPPPSPFE